ncbi:ABC transporter ATP-binding protein [Planococcus sp. SSTMD024]|uniref:ABC transporter ATP-binding protein n=1 Tax=Planococcus sp. SSTMD024 TaxID=3242163 RepID=UPI00351F4ADE
MSVPNPIYQLDDVSFRFPESAQPTLHSITLAIHPQERVVITGPSGCGKSTLLYVLNRLYPHNCDGEVSGNVRIFGRASQEYEPGEANRKVATVFQDPDSQFCMPTVEEELAFTLENLQVPREEMPKRIDRILRMTGLDNMRDGVIQTFSGGMKQRIATACALIMEPDCLLLDEPLAHLDPLTAKEFVAWLDQLQQERGLAVVAVEHKLELWDEFFDREISLSENGAILKDQAYTKWNAPFLPKRETAKQPKVLFEAKDVSIIQASKSLLRGAGLQLYAGEVMVIAGPNGSGKSTLLKALCGIMKRDSGTISGEFAGFVPQSPEQLFLSKTVEEELSYSGNSSSHDVKNLLEALSLEPIAHAHPFSVSHGQKRRVAIGAMLADRRQVLLLDEPTAGQDLKALRELHHQITCRAQDGCALVVVTHDMNFAMSIADTICLMRDGRLSDPLEPQELFSSPALLAEHRLYWPEKEKCYATSFT